jgi:hypothetical protein
MKENLGMSMITGQRHSSRTSPQTRCNEGLLTSRRALGRGAGLIKQASMTQPGPVAGNLLSYSRLRPGSTAKQQERMFAWLELAQTGATEGLLTKPEERLEEEPEWVRQAKTLGDQPHEIPSAGVPGEEVKEVPATEPEPAAGLEELGKSEAERDDAFAWLESLAAKQGATEGLLTKPRTPGRRT